MFYILSKYVAWKKTFLTQNYEFVSGFWEDLFIIEEQNFVNIVFF